MVEGRKKLRNVERQGACGFAFDPTRSNYVSQRDTGINSGFEFKTTQLARVDEIVGCYDELYSFCNNFFDEFAESVEEDDWSESFGIIIRRLVWFGYDDGRRSLEVIWPVP